MGESESLCKALQGTMKALKKRYIGYRPFKGKNKANNVVTDCFIYLQFDTDIDRDK